jgi:hypothetical protein
MVLMVVLELIVNVLPVETRIELLLFRDAKSDAFLFSEIMKS